MSEEYKCGWCGGDVETCECYDDAPERNEVND